MPEKTIEQLRAERDGGRVKAARARKKLAMWGRVKLRWQRLVAKRNTQIAAAKQTGPKRALKWALTQVGVTEHPFGSNDGPQVGAWNRATLGFSGFAWCQSFANAVLVHGGGEQLKSAYTVAVVQWAREQRFGLRVVSYADRRPGDFVYYKFPGVSRDFCDHVEVVLDADRTIGGNTSPDTGGSQNNGGCVAIKRRGGGFVVAVVRPTYGA